MNPGDYASAITQFTQAVANNLTAFVSAMAAVGVLSMAIIQTLKDMFPLRNWYQRAYLRAWLASKRGAAGGAADPLAAERDLVRLATSGDDKALFDIPIEQLCGQIGAAMQVVLDYPAQHADLLRLMAANAEREDVERLIAASPPAAGGKRAQEEVDSRARVMHFVQRAIDGLQIAAGYRWKLYLQIASFVLSFLITVFGVGMQPNGLAMVQVPGILLIGVAGGFLAPVARDLLAALQKLR